MFLGIDIGGTSIKGAQVLNNTVLKAHRIPVDGTENEQEFLSKIEQLILFLNNPEIKAIGVGVPGIVDAEPGIIYDIQNIPLLRKVPLKSFIEKTFKLPVYVNNDANCFAIGEKLFGKGKDYTNFLGVTIGTGLGLGIIINNRLYSGELCGAGEIGMLPYKDSNIEHYTGSLFFKHQYKTTGEALFQDAENRNKKALDIFNEYGHHLGNAVLIMLYLYAPQAIILGGAISGAYPYFENQLKQRISTFEFQEQLKNFKIHIAENKDMGILGAAALCVKNIS